MIAPPLAETLHKHGERWRARDRERPLLKLGRSTVDAVEGGPPCWCGGESPLYLVVCGWLCTDSALCRSQRVEVSTSAACCVPLRSMYQVTLYPESKGQRLCACVCPNHSSSTGLRHHQQLQQLRVSGRVNVTLAVGRTFNVPSKFTQQQ